MVVTSKLKLVEKKVYQGFWKNALGEKLAGTSGSNRGYWAKL